MSATQSTTGPSTHDALAAAGERLLVVVAHPDDETFGCGSIIAAAASAGASVTVLCATLGDRGESRLALTRDQLARQRRRELHLAAGVLGAENVITLGYGDSDFAGDLPHGSLCAADEDRVVADILATLRLVQPDVVVVLDGCDGHRDHLRIRSATTAAVDIERAVGATIALYESSLPNHLMRRWLDEMRTIAPDAAYHSIDPARFGRSDEEITHVVDARAVIDRRELAIAMHVSQASPFDGLSPDLRAAFLAEDHLARVR
jgi:N-acetyl-1-D-myo-inositol-2-amino-2-deoxy-alpha-D-glucopyranoside deacetylase